MQFLLDHEYVAMIYLALVMFIFLVPKRKFFYIPLIVSFFLIETYWHYRPLEAPFDYLVIYLLMCISTWLIFDIDFFKTLFIITCIFGVQHISYKSTMIFITLISYNLRGEWVYLVLQVCFICLLNLIIYYAFLRKKSIDEVLKVNNIYLLGIAVLILILNIVVSYYSEDPLLEINKYYLYSLVNVYAIVSSIFGIFLLFLSSSKKQVEQERNMLEVILKKDEKRYELAKITQEQINIKYHDLKHYIQEHKLNEEDTREIEKEGKMFKSIYYTGNKTLDVVLLEKNLVCSKYDIHFLTIADGTLLDFMKMNHIYSLLSNLLDNAIESCEKCKLDKRIIRLNISKQRNSVVLLLENSLNETPLFKNGLPETTKQDKLNHGFGLKSIKNIVDKYDGYLDISYNNELFIIKIVFPIKEKNN